MNATYEVIGRYVLVSGLIIALVGLLLMFAGKLPWIGRLPGDLLFTRRNFTLYIPLATSLILSLLVSLIVYFLGRK